MKLPKRQWGRLAAGTVAFIVIQFLFAWWADGAALFTPRKMTSFIVGIVVMVLIFLWVVSSSYHK